jgi:glutamate-1-semialdehyde 2,1-aminomutase
MRTLTKSREMFQRASRVLLFGVTPNYRYWGPDDTIYIERGKGAHLWDVDGNRYIDYRMGYGPAILGHSDDRVDSAVITEIGKGHIFATSIPLEHQVAEKIVAMVPSVEMVRFTPSGTESTQHALRLARAYTRREKFIMFEGNYNGLHDHVMFDAHLNSNRRSPTSIPRSSGIPRARRAGHPAAVQRLRESRADRQADLARRRGHPGRADLGQLRRHPGRRRIPPTYSPFVR